jgi:hypothetical protein
MKSVAENCAEWVRVAQRNERLWLGTATEADYAELNQLIDGRGLVELAYEVKAQVEGRSA